ncbi:esterase-like activity of phytase family protein [Martelella sp. HB161492]|uniref:esterase-like activity of phytase family protein n=1 Tax=Martelella sp. HB161492 TaxID=2720726 RepID=UPI0015917831|nr:esterase-like activity of phytase family protein [Martelella sp. HB161492]
MKSLFLAALATLAAGTALADETVFPARLAAHAILPGNTIIAAPADAPAYIQTSAKFLKLGVPRVDAVGSVAGMDGKRPTGLATPFAGQPMQGFSGIKAMDDGTFWSLSDNGFGSKANSSDAALMIHHLAFDWDKGTVTPVTTIFLSDPDRIAPFPIVLEGSDSRYLTGADFDIESIQPVADGFWIGDELGPYVLKFNPEGQLQAVYDTLADGKPVRSPDNPALSLPNPGGKMPTYNLPRSGGYEGMAISPDGAHLYALLEKPLVGEDGKPETVDGHEALRVLEFDTAKADWTGRFWFYPLSDGGTNIGDFNMIDATTGLIIERDGGEGDPALACADSSKDATDCFAHPALHKRIYKIEMTDENANGAARKIGYIDLMNIADPDGLARQGGADGIYTMPFVTIENVDVIDPTHIIVGNDNNLPFSAGRKLDAVDNNEFVILDVADFLNAK